jgi:cell division protein FtsL
MAVIGARPATGPWFLPGRARPRPRPRRPQVARGARRGGVRRRVARRIEVRPYLLAILVAAGLAFFYLSQSTGVAATGYEIDALEARLSEVRAEQQQLVSDIGEARSPAEIVRRAREQLDLVPLPADVVTYAPPQDDPAD